MGDKRCPICGKGEVTPGELAYHQNRRIPYLPPEDRETLRAAAEWFQSDGRYTRERMAELIRAILARLEGDNG